ncbi:unnamed protein product [Arctogadus glacialis]
MDGWIDAGKGRRQARRREAAVSHAIPFVTAKQPIKRQADHWRRARVASEFGGPTLMGVILRGVHHRRGNVPCVAENRVASWRPRATLTVRDDIHRLEATKPLSSVFSLTAPRCARPATPLLFLLVAERRVEAQASGGPALSDPRPSDRLSRRDVAARCLDVHGGAAVRSEVCVVCGWISCSVAWRRRESGCLEKVFPGRWAGVEPPPHEEMGESRATAASCSLEEQQM